MTTPPPNPTDPPDHHRPFAAPADPPAPPAAGSSEPERPAAEPGGPHVGTADGGWPAAGYGGGPFDPSPFGRRPRDLGPQLWRAAAVLAVLAVLGAPLGLLWRALAPDVPLRMTEDGPILTSPQPEQFVAADGWFALLGVAFGVLAAVVVWAWLRRYRGAIQLAAVVLGAVAAGLIGWWVGRQLGLAAYRDLIDTAAAGTLLEKPADLRASEITRLGGLLPVVRGDVLAPALGAAVVYTLLAGWSRYPGLRPHEEAEQSAALTLAHAAATRPPAEPWATPAPPPTHPWAGAPLAPDNHPQAPPADTPAPPPTATPPPPPDSDPTRP
ncbi:hypothetical protein GCM10010123_14270 [Pilimelia anulata]|uniref:DUF2567 domain-containing protein n=1 Tax=Pilimelia anulata TaxID=53371 RepID=A0A8J3F8D5_9ACTN|nr:DUF2567 domain-containing protein [Pilimelia anulata]GGJ85780.1 hypothetical protein GCM10010123_14270 [Pilimelia anulata]